MIVELRVKNYRSIGDEQVFSMVAGSGDENPENVIEPQSRMKHRLLRSAVLYGANASGKSNLFRALFAMRRLVLNSTDHKPGDHIDISPFVFRKELRKKPTEFDLTFIHDGVRYQYGFAVDQNSFREEWLYAYPKGQSQLLFHRDETNRDNVSSPYKWGSNLTGEKKTIAGRTTKNVLFLSKAANENHPLLHDVFLWFSRSLRVENMYGPPSNMMSYTTGLIHESDDVAIWARRFIQQADFGIIDLNTETCPIVEDPHFMKLPKDVQNRFLDDHEQYEAVAVKSVHTSNPGVKMDLDEESVGTKRYYGLSGPLFRVFQEGITLAIDELDSSMHPLLIRRIVDMFHDPEVNKNNAQLIFTTHDTTLLKPDIFRRDQVWFVEKDRKEQSQYYSLLEYRMENGEKPRKDESWERGYLAGRYGAIPFLGRFRF